ncbi:hypothetical protein J6590_097765, partial [Homalodisca vitripennis]
MLCDRQHRLAASGALAAQFGIKLTKRPPPGINQAMALINYSCMNGVSIDGKPMCLLMANGPYLVGEYMK